MQSLKTAFKGAIICFTFILLHQPLQAQGCWKILAKGSSATHSAAIAQDGTLWAWGLNANGQLGDGTTTNRNSPLKVGSANNWLTVVIGGDYTIAIKTDGTLWACGLNSNGQLGDGTTIQRLNFVQIGTATNWLKVSAGRYHTVATKTDGTLWTWGLNSNGQLGDGTITQRSSPLQIGTATNWLTIASGGSHTIATKTDSTLWAWGSNNSGQLGDGTNTQRTSPIQIGNATNWQMLTVGNDHSIATKTNGTLWGWGNNVYGQLGDGTSGINASKNSPAQIGRDANWLTIAAGDVHTIAIKTDGTLWAWGRNIYSELGDFSTEQRNYPIQIGSAANWLSVTAGDSHTIATKTDGSFWSWGYNGVGELGDGTNTNRTSPTNIACPYGTIVRVEPCWKVISGSVGIALDGSLWTWGGNEYGQIGDGTTSRKAVTSPVRIGTATNWKTVAAGGSFKIATRTDSTMWSWGYNYNGQLGDSSRTDKTVPVLANKATNWQTISAGGSHTIATKTDGTLWAWGFNQYGELGDGTTTFKISPVQIGTDTNWLIVVAGNQISIAIKTDGTLWAWGYNSSGQFGNGTIGTNSKIPIQIGVDRNWKTISIGDDHTIAIKTDGTLWAWGTGYYGQIGDGNNFRNYSPMQIGVATNWQSAGAGLYYTIATKTDGSLWGWGINEYGQLGDGTTYSKSIPVQIGTATNWLKASAVGFTLATKIDGSFWGWGPNGGGQLGDGTTIEKYIPTALVCPSNFSLPVTYTSFTATKQGSTVLLNWQTATEVNNAYFIVQHSTNGSNWANIGKINAGNGNYRFVHTTPTTGTNYYRLQQVDKDGKSNYSNVVNCQLLEAGKTLSIYPNPTVGTTIVIDVAKAITKPFSYNIYNVLGGLVQQGTISQMQQTISISTLSKGLYLLRLSNGQTASFIKQ